MLPNLEPEFPPIDLFSGHFRTVEADTTERQGTQIVQPQLNLRDFLP